MPDRREERDVEDVLSSVRRLVSGELAHRVRRTSPPQALVLTPTQRVSQARERAGAQSLEDRIAELEAQLAGRQDEWEPDGSEDQSAHRPTETFARAVRLDDPAVASSSEPPRRVEPDIFVPDIAIEEDEIPPLPPRVRRLSRIELIETSPAEDDDVPAAAEIDDDPQAKPKPDFDRDLARAVARSVNSVISEITRTEGPLHPEEGHAEAGSEADEDKTEDATGWQEDDEAAASEVREVLDSATRLHADLDMLVTDDPTHPEHDAMDGGGVPSEAIKPASVSALRVDDAEDDDLRALVGQLIREELQGELGARITRNLRKLVRREIQRALATRDLS